MIQIIGLRKYIDQRDGKEKVKQKCFGEHPSHGYIFKNITDVVENIPESERWNVYFTSLDCKDRAEVKKLRYFHSQPIIPFDLDNIDLEKKQTYIDLFFKTFPLEYEKTVVISTGNGLQFLVKLHDPFTEKTCFDEWRLHYQFICKRFNAVLEAEKLEGDLDPVVWSEGRILRLPGTENRKPPPKGIKQATLIQGNLEAQPFDWVTMSGVEKLEATETVDWSEEKNGLVDHKEIYSKCSFIQSTLDVDVAHFREPHFYAATSILARMEGGEQRVLRLRDAVRDCGSDSSVAGYSDDMVESKIAAALSLTGPRTCKSIRSLHAGCDTCPMRKEVKSPIAIKGPDFIASEKNGFTYVGPRGGVKYLYQDLAKYFQRDTHFKVLRDNGLVWVWEGNRYRAATPTELRNFALNNFKPTPGESKPFSEFKAFVENSNLVDSGFFNGPQLNGKLNCANGVLDLVTGDLEPHNPDFGFQYCLPYEYDADASCPTWLQFMDDIMLSDPGNIKVLQEFLGYAISGSTYKHHKFLMLAGTGRNGKGTMMSIISELAGGSRNVSAVSMTEMQKNENNRQLLEGKLFNFADETDVNEFKNTALLKKITGEGEILVKLMYNQPYLIHSRAKLVFSCNELPSLNDTSHAFKQRMIAIPFNARFTADKGNVDINIRKKLLKELPGVLNWCIEGYRRLEKQESFSVSASATEFADDYFVSNNPLEHWVEETSELEISPLNGKCTWVSTQDIYAKYIDWAFGKGRGYELSFQAFSTKLRALLPDHAQRGYRTRLGQGRFRGFFDLSLGADTYAVQWAQGGAGPKLFKDWPGLDVTAGPGQDVDFL